MSDRIFGPQSGLPECELTRGQGCYGPGSYLNPSDIRKRPLPSGLLGRGAWQAILVALRAEVSCLQDTPRTLSCQFNSRPLGGPRSVHRLL